MQILIFFLNSRFGRCESLNDMWIAGEFDIKQIKCNFFAKAEVEKLALKAKTTREAAFFAFFLPHLFQCKILEETS